MNELGKHSLDSQMYKTSIKFNKKTKKGTPQYKCLKSMKKDSKNSFMCQIR
jgi:hypothetical protein